MLGDDDRECAIECMDKMYYWWWRSIIVRRRNKSLFHKCKSMPGDKCIEPGGGTWEMTLGNRQVFCGFIVKVKWKRREREEESFHSPFLRTHVACLLEQVESNSQGTLFLSCYKGKLNIMQLVAVWSRQNIKQVKKFDCVWYKSTASTAWCQKNG
jgi:hypothetical protein